MTIKRILFCFLCVTSLSCKPSPTELEKMPAESLFRDPQVLELVLAGEHGDVDRIKELAKQGVDVNSRGKYDVTPLLRSVLKKNKSGFDALLNLGADPNVLDIYGNAATLLAAEEEDSTWLRAALAHGGNPNLVNKGVRFFGGQTPLFYAIQKSRVENAKLLIDAGANVNHQSDDIGRPLHRATDHTYVIVLLLLQAGAEYRYPGFDLVKSMNGELEFEHLIAVGHSKESAAAFYKTVEFLEKKGERFVRNRN